MLPSLSRDTKRVFKVYSNCLPFLRRYCIRSGPRAHASARGKDTGIGPEKKKKDDEREAARNGERGEGEKERENLSYKLGRISLLI